MTGTQHRAESYRVSCAWSIGDRRAHHFPVRDPPLARWSVDRCSDAPLGRRTVLDWGAVVLGKEQRAKHEAATERASRSMSPDLTDDEKAALIELLRDNDRSGPLPAVAAHSGAGDPALRRAVAGDPAGERATAGKRVGAVPFYSRKRRNPRRLESQQGAAMSDLRYGETVTLLVPYEDPRTLALADARVHGLAD
jgi:hypothetical protein